MTDPLLVLATTYEPEPAQVEQLAGMLAACGSPAMVVDNSTTPAARDLVRRSCASHGLEVVGDGRNTGTAGALNAGLQRAMSLGATWLLYFDQDSRVGAGFWRRAATAIDTVAPQVAVVGSRIVHVGSVDAPAPEPQGMEAAAYVIASGTTFRVAHVREVGGFDEGLALDLVDHELCLRLRDAGRELRVDTARHILHEIGRGSRQTGVRGTRVTRHPRWRRRMMWRNSLVVCRRYARRHPRTCLRHLVGRVWETLAGAVLFRDPLLLVAAGQGVIDGLRAGTAVVGPDAPADHPGRARLP